MNANTATALAYLLVEAANTGLKISDMLSKVQEDGSLPPEELAKVKANLKEDFASAKEFWSA